MSALRDNRRPRPFRLGLFKPAGLLAIATTLAAAYFVCDLLGMRQAVSAIYATAHAPQYWGLGWAMLYTLLYFGVVIIAPVLALGAGILFIANWLLDRRRLDDRML